MTRRREERTVMERLARMRLLGERDEERNTPEKLHVGRQSMFQSIRGQ